MAIHALSVANVVIRRVRLQQTCLGQAPFCHKVGLHPGAARSDIRAPSPIPGLCSLVAAPAVVKTRRCGTEMETPLAAIRRARGMAGFASPASTPPTRKGGSDALLACRVQGGDRAHCRGVAVTIAATSRRHPPGSRQETLTVRSDNDGDVFCDGDRTGSAQIMLLGEQMRDLVSPTHAITAPIRPLRA